MTQPHSVGAATVKTPVPKFALNPGVFERTILKDIARSVQLNIFRNKSSYSSKNSNEKHRSHSTRLNNCNEFVFDVRTIAGLPL